MKSTDALTDIKKSDFLLFSAVMLILAVDFRLCLLWLKPFHSDEGVNAHFLLDLVRHGKYVYDPENYHGPFIYFITAALVKLFGLTDFALRFSPVLFSIFQLALLFTLKSPLRKAGVLTALALMGFSPSVTFFARSFIHETYFISFTLAAFVSLYFLIEKRNVRFLIPAALSVALMITVKETFVITVACWCLAVVPAWLWVQKGKVKLELRFKFRDALETIVMAAYAGLAVCAFLLIYLLLYSSFFQNPEGPWRAIESLFHWQDRSRYDHVKGFLYYFNIMYKFETPTLLLALFGIVYSLVRRKFFSVYLSCWTVCSFLVYSLIPYKTPWLLLNILLPAALTASAAVGDITDRWLTHKSRKEAFALFILILVLWPAAVSAKVNFFRYDDDRMPMVYVQTHRSYKNLFPVWNVLSMKYGNETKTAILSPSYWPLPWDLRDHKTVGYYAKLESNLEGHPFLITEDTQRVETRKIYGQTHHKLEMPFALHSGYDLYLWIRNDMWEDTFGDLDWRPWANGARN